VLPTNVGGCQGCCLMELESGGEGDKDACCYYIIGGVDEIGVVRQTVWSYPR
jgi:hypothetical protein